MRRLLALFAALSMLFTMSVGTANAAYYSQCTTVPSGSGAFSPTWHLARGSATFTEMTATAIIRPLYACTNPNGKAAASMVLPANLQDGEINPFVQLGWGELGPGQGNVWVWTANPASGGVVSELSGQIPPSGVWGQEVRFRIRPSTLDGVAVWWFEIKAMTGAYAGVKLAEGFTTRGDSTVTTVWAGIEVKNWASQFGGAGPTNRVYIFDMAYQHTGNHGVWTHGCL